MEKVSGYLDIKTLDLAPNETEHGKFLREYRAMKNRIVNFLVNYYGIDLKDANRMFFQLTETTKKLILIKIGELE